MSLLQSLLEVVGATLVFWGVATGILALLAAVAEGLR